VDEKIIRIATYSNPVEAEMAKNYLEDAGVTVFSAGAEVSAPFAGVDAGFANVELHVPQSHYERAVRALAQFEDHDMEVENLLADNPMSEAVETAEESVEGRDAFASTGFRSGPPPGETDEEEGSEFVRLPGQDERDVRDADDVSIHYTPDDLAARAWRASFVGLLLFPITYFVFPLLGLLLPVLLHIYSIWLLCRIGSMDQEVRPGAMWKIYGALILDAFVLVLVILILLVILAR